MKNNNISLLHLIISNVLSTLFLIKSFYVINSVGGSKQWARKHVHRNEKGGEKRCRC